MWYSIFGEDIEHSLEKRMAIRPAHLDRLLELKNEGRLLIAGPHPSIDCEDPGSAGFTGSLIIAEFENLQRADYVEHCQTYDKWQYVLYGINRAMR